MNKVTPFILLAGASLLVACSETANSKSNQQTSSPTTSLGTTSNVDSKEIPAIVVEEPEAVKQAVAESTPVVESSYPMSAKDEKRFNRYDVDGDGGVSLSEYTETLRKHYEKNSPDKDASVIGPKRFHQQDANGDGALSPKEFLTKRKK